MGRQTPDDLPLPPHSVEAEQGLLAAAMLDNQIAVNLEIQPTDFYRDTHRRIWSHLCRLIERGDLADIVTIADSLERAGEAEQCGGISYLATIANQLASPAAAPSYARIIRESAEKRRLQGVYYEAARSAGNGIDTDALVALTEERIRQARIQAEKPRPVTTMDWVGLEARCAPDRDWLIDGWLGAGQPTLLAGPGGSGKSLLAQQASSCMCVGREFIGPIQRQLKVLMWMCEDDHDEIWRRQVAISHWLQLPLSAFTNLTIVPRLGLDNTLLTTEFGRPIWTPLLRELREQSQDLQSDVVVCDNIGQMYGASENERHPVTLFVNGVTGAVGKASTIFIGHPAKAAGSEFSGSTAWENAMRMRWHFSDRLPDDKEQDPETEKDSSLRFLCKRKTNYSTKDYCQFNWTNGVFTQTTNTNPDQALLDTQAQRAVLTGTEQLANISVFGSDKPSSSYLPSLLLRYGFGEGLTTSLLAKAMRSLMLQGKLKRAEVGKDSARRPKFGIVVA